MVRYVKKYNIKKMITKIIKNNAVSLIIPKNYKIPRLIENFLEDFDDTNYIYKPRKLESIPECIKALEDYNSGSKILILIRNLYKPTLSLTPAPIKIGLILPISWKIPKDVVGNKIEFREEDGWNELDGLDIKFSNSDNYLFELEDLPQTSNYRDCVKNIIELIKNYNLEHGN